MAEGEERSDVTEDARDDRSEKRLLKPRQRPSGARWSEAYSRARVGGIRTSGPIDGCSFRNGGG